MPADVDIETVSPQGLDLQERVIEINRVAKVVKGGRRFSFTALVAVGDEESVVGIGYGKAREVPLAIQKAVENARKSLVRIPKLRADHPAPQHRPFRRRPRRPAPGQPGYGVIAGGGVRAVLELAGIRDVLSKSIGSQNPINLVKATMNGLTTLRRPEEVAKLRGLSINEVLGIYKEPKATETLNGEGEADPVTPEAVAAEAPSAGSDPVAEPTPEPASDEGSDPTSADAAAEEKP